VGAILITLLPRILAFAAAQQAYGIMVVWADTAVDRTVGAFEIPVTWILTADGILTILGVLFANRVWSRLATNGREPGDIRKIGIGNVMISASFVIVGLVAAMAQVPLVAWLGFYLVLGFSYAWIDPPSKALIARYAPQSVNGTMFAMSALAGAFGFFALGYLGRFYEPLGASLYFLFAAPISRLLETAERDDPAGFAGEPQLA
jgi:POT family proton-dependent oligopeptide transporter